ncbi:fibronectin type III domain-containing protein [Curtobacterium sp. 9128]|uniref:fibronectin type III domain-containing protein n=1 Tax=Curtobacterium sp. 9128 TaxID=1793722 RepID=UPI0011A4B82E|nr:fibronectin type III domain-containing protein [Curtobacterium sp. 9128]
MSSRSARRHRRARFSAAAVAAALVAALSVIAAPAASAAPATGTVDRSAASDGGAINGSGTFGQVFIAGRSGVLTGADVNYYPNNTSSWTNGATSGTVFVYAGAGPNSTPLASGTISLQGGWQTVEFATPPTVTAGSSYFLALPPSAVYTGRVATPGEGMLNRIYDYRGSTSLNYREYVLSIPAPTGVAATAGAGSAELTWSAPTLPADTTLTGYETEYAVSGSGEWSSPTATTSTTATVSGLTNGTPYDFRVRATTDHGSGLWSATATATPIADVAGGTLTVSSTAPAVGATVTATTDGWTPTPTLSWKWTVAGVPVSDSSSYTPTPDDLGKDIQVTVTANADGRRPATRTADLGAVAAGTIVPGAVRIASGQDSPVGSAVGAGTLLTASLPAVEPSGSAVTWQWYRDSTNVPIPGATTAEYTVTGRDAVGGHGLFVIASVASPGYTATTATSATVIAENGTQTGAVTTSGATVGQPVTAATTGWSPSGATVTYQWYDGEQAIPGATSSTYTPTAAQAGHALHVLATGTAEGYDTSSVASTPVVVAEGTPTGTVGIDGTPTVGSALTATDSGWLAGTTFDRQWTRNGAAIDGATGATYTPTADDLDAVIGITVTGRLAGYTDRTAVAATGTAVVVGTQHGTVAIDGTGPAQVGTGLTADSTGWVDGTELSYRWLRDGSAIDGATEVTYTPVEADIDHVVTVEVTGTLPGWNPLIVTSAGTAPVAGVPASVTPDSAVPTTAVAGKPFRYHVDVAGSPAPTVAIDGALPAGLRFDPATGDLTGTATKAGHSVIRFTAVNGIGIPAVTTVTINVVPGALDTLTLTTAGTGTANGAVTAKQGSTIRVTATGFDAWGNALATPGDVALTSSMASDEVRGDTVTFHHASPHVITAHVGTVSASVTVEVSPTAAVAPAAATGADTTTAQTSGTLAYTGAEGAGPTAIAAFLAVLLGFGLRTGVRRSRQRS